MVLFVLNVELIVILNGLGHSSTSEDVDDLVSRLRQSEEQVNELKERLKTATSNVEQYRAMMANLEESLNKEKQVQCFSHGPTHWI